MSATSKCPHSDMHFNLTITHMVDSNVKALSLDVTCRTCGAPMRFLGFPMGISLAQPTTSVDGKEARIPIVPADEEPDKTIGLIVSRVEAVG